MVSLSFFAAIRERDDFLSDAYRFLNRINIFGNIFLNGHLHSNREYIIVWTGVSFEID